MTRTSHPCISRGIQAGNANFEIQGSAIQLQRRSTPAGDSKPPTPSRGKPCFSFRPGSRTGNRAALRQRQAAEKGQNEKSAWQRQLPKQNPEEPHVRPHEEPQRQTTGQPEVSKQKPEKPEEQQQSNPEPPTVPTWEGGHIKGLRTPQRPGSAATALGLARSASVPNVQRPSSAPAMPSNEEMKAEIKKDPAKWYIPANTYRTQYMHDYSDVTTENANGAPRPKSAAEVRRELDERHAKQSTTRRPSTPSLDDLTAYFYTSETAAQFRKYTETETADCRGTFCDWQTNKEVKKREDQIKEELHQLRQSREARKAHRPPKVPLKQDTPTSSGRRPDTPSSSGRRPKSLADLLNMQKGQTPVPNRNAKPDDDATSEATTASAPAKESLSEVCSLDSARTDSSARTTASSVYSSRSSASCRSSISSASTRSSSSSRSSASLRTTSSKRSSSKDSTSTAGVSASSRSSSSSRKESVKKLDKLSTGSVCGSSMCSDRPSTAASDRPSTAASECSASSATTLTNRSVKTDGSNGTKKRGTSVDRLQLDNKLGQERPNIPNLELDKKPGEIAKEPKLQTTNAHVANITTTSRHIG